MMLLEALTRDLSPTMQTLVMTFQRMIPNEAMQGLEDFFEGIVRDLANERYTEACVKMSALLEHLGIDLNEYRD